ncbi:MAG: pyruvate dehydrogenase (acetyl-transferring) E1 component subunit alpha [Candidatus Aenigmarchaeota archaeon]|nr:pyruvate dehydrogenase (acetyl-transferring) E1 component subunit alpha [Candidatus Aenigmarchaeota archaeon]
MEKILARFDVPYLQVLNEKGETDKKLMPKFSKDAIMKMYEVMVLTRTADDVMLKLQREGRMGTYAPARGQEASQVGSTLALRGEDWLFPLYRDIGSMIIKGMPLSLILRYFRGDERGMCVPRNVNMFPTIITVAGQCPHAVGAAMAAKIRSDKIAVMCSFGDGASSKGDFYEAANFAGVFHSPVVFLCQNNQYAISVPRSSQSAAETIAQKAIAFGFPGVQVDGNDVFAVYKASLEAVERARAGKGPTLVECFTYRMGDHTTSDDASRYRSREEVSEWVKKDPVARLEKYMVSENVMTGKEMKEIAASTLNEVEKAVKEAESAPKQDAGDIFRFMYAEMPKRLQSQRDYLKRFEGDINGKR